MMFQISKTLLFFLLTFFSANVFAGEKRIFTSVVFECDANLNHTKGTLTLCKVRAPLALHIATAGLLFLEPSGVLTLAANAGLFSIRGHQIEFKAKDPTAAKDPTLKQLLANREIQREAMSVLEAYFDMAMAAIKNKLGKEKEEFDVAPFDAYLDASVYFLEREVTDFPAAEELIFGTPPSSRTVHRRYPAFEVTGMVLIATVISRRTQDVDFYIVNLNDLLSPKVAKASNLCEYKLDKDGRVIRYK